MAFVLCMSALGHELHMIHRLVPLHSLEMPHNLEEKARTLKTDL